MQKFKYVFLFTFLLLFSNVKNSQGYIYFLFNNADNIVSGTLDPERVSPSTFTLQGNNINILSTVTVITDRLDGIDLINTSIATDTTTLKTRIDNLDTSTASLTTRIVGHDLFRSTATEMITYSSEAANSYRLFEPTSSSKMADMYVFKSTAEQKIDSYNLFKSSFETTSASISSLTVYGTITSTSGFIGGESTFTVISINGVSYQFPSDNGDNLEYLKTDGNGVLDWASIPTAGRNAYSIVIGTESLQNVDLYGETESVFNTAISSLVTYGGTIRIRKGIYTFSNPITVPSNITLDFEDGAVIKNAATTTNVLFNLGTLINPHFTIENNWTSDYVLRVGTNSKTYNLKMDGIINVKASVDNSSGALSFVGENALVRGININVKNPNGGSSVAHIVNFNGSVGGILDGNGGTYTNEKGKNNDGIEIGGSTMAVIRNIYFNGGCESVISQYINSASTQCLIENNIALATGTSLSGGFVDIRAGTVHKLTIKNNVLGLNHGTTFNNLYFIYSAVALIQASITDNMAYTKNGILIPAGSSQCMVHGNHLFTGGLSDSGTGTLDRDNVLNNAFIAE